VGVAPVGAAPAITLDVDNTPWVGKTININKLKKGAIRQTFAKVEEICGLSEEDIKVSIRAKVPQSSNPLVKWQQENHSMNFVAGLIISAQHTDPPLAANELLENPDKLRQFIDVAVTSSLISEDHYVHAYNSPPGSDPALRSYLDVLPDEFKSNPVAMQAVGLAHMIIKTSGGLNGKEKDDFIRL
jgi:hypothetical protein